MPRIMSYEGSNCFRQRIILATLANRRLIVEKIRISEEEPGLTEAEVSLLNLMEKVSNGSTVEIDETGTCVTFTPGILIGGKIEHECGLDRSIAYFLEVLFAVSPFCKYPLDVTLKGITNDNLDPSVDSMKQSHLPVLRRFLRVFDDKEVSLNITSRGLKPRGGGIVNFTCPVRRTLKPMQWLESGKVKRVRGVAFACRVSPQTANRMVDTSKGLLLKYLPDVFIHTEHMHGSKSGSSPGFGLVLWAETTKGVFYVGQAMSRLSGEENAEPSIPEDVATKATHALFEEIFRGGCVDSTAQSLCFLFMSLGETDLSKIVVGPLTPFSVQFLRHLKDVFDLTFKLDAVTTTGKTGSKKTQAACVGIGFSNLSKTIS